MSQSVIRRPAADRGEPADHSSEPSAPGTAAAEAQAPAAAEQLSRAATPASAPTSWRPRVRRGAIVSDCAIMVVSVVGSQIAQFGVSDYTVSGAGELSYTTLSAVLVVAWIAALAISGAWHPKIFMSGAPGYGRIIKASFTVFGLLAIVSYLGKWEVGRAYVAIAIPMGMVALLVARLAWRSYVLHARRSGDMMSRTLVVGGFASGPALARQFSEAPQAGYEVVGLCLPVGYSESGDSETPALPAPVVGTLDQVIETAHRLSVNTIAVARTDRFSPERLRKLSWALEGTDLDLVMAPMFSDLAGPRIHSEPVPGLPLVHMQRPHLAGPQLWLKTTFDYTAALLGLVLVSPILLATATAIKLDDGGPVFFRQERVGLKGRTFRIWKFRSMAVDAEARLAAERARVGQSREVFFKAFDDSRITRVGHLIRKTSVDELPQLFNVLSGRMSLVGPRPLTPGEGSELDGFLSRRALVKPGVTGLWQVSGRSEITGEQRARLDLLYVENWSFFGDLGILSRTMKAVVRFRAAV